MAEEGFPLLPHDCLASVTCNGRALRPLRPSEGNVQNTHRRDVRNVASVSEILGGRLCFFICPNPGFRWLIGERWLACSACKDVFLHTLPRGNRLRPDGPRM